LIKNADRIKQEKRKNIIKDSEEDIRIRLNLVRLDNNIDLPLSINEIKSFVELENNDNSIKNFLIEQGFRAIQQRLENNSFINKNTENKVINKSAVSTNFITINDISKFATVIEEIKTAGIVAIDTETNSLDIEKAELVGVSLSYNEDNAYYIPINHKNIETGRKVKDQLSD
jgi:DNA polymerase-1